MNTTNVDYKEEFRHHKNQKAFNNGLIISFIIIGLYLVFTLFGKLVNPYFKFNSIAFLGILPSFIYIALFSWFKKNNKQILLFSGLMFLGLNYTLSYYLYEIFSATAIADLVKIESILFVLIILFSQSILSQNLRKNLHYFQAIPIIASIFLLAVSVQLSLKDGLLLSSLPIIILFLFLMNWILEKKFFTEFSKSISSKHNELELVSEIERRKRAEEELHKHKDRLKLIVEERTQNIKQKTIELEKAKLKAEEADRLKTAFMATMSHELRTPLNAIIGFTELIDKDTPRQDFLEFAEIINKSGIRLLNTVEDIFQLTYIETKEIEIYKEKFNLNGFINSLMDNYEEEKENFHKPYLKLTFTPGLSDEDCFVNSDAKRLKTILDKLVNNAIKFTKIGSIEIGYNYAIEGEFKDHFIFQVKDTGIGIAKEHHEMIFDRFRQVEETNTRNYEGSGLGVTIAKELAKLLGGDMWLESEPDNGSIFFFALPLEIHGQPDKQEEVKAEHQKSIPDFSKKRILIAEDTESNFRLLEQYLKKTNIEIIWALDGVEAVDFCKQEKDIDLILMDIKMPNMNGYEATTEIKKLGVTCPVIAQTAYALQDDEVKTFTAGCDAYLSKPIKSRELYKCMERYMNN